MTLDPCQCRDAALRTYRELRACGERDTVAFSAAVQIYRHYHPQASLVHALDIVASWIDDDLTASKTGI